MPCVSRTVWTILLHLRLTFYVAVCQHRTNAAVSSPSPLQQSMCHRPPAYWCKPPFQLLIGWCLTDVTKYLKSGWHCKHPTKSVWLWHRLYQNVSSQLVCTWTFLILGVSLADNAWFCLDESMTSHTMACSTRSNLFSKTRNLSSCGTQVAGVRPIVIWSQFSIKENDVQKKVHGTGSTSSHIGKIDIPHKMSMALNQVDCK